MARNKNKSKAVFEALSEMVFGQDHAVDIVSRRVNVFEAGLNPEGRPAGVLFLLGPTGSGKTHMAESLAHALHGSKRHVLRVDCGEYQLEHEVAKLIGAPPGYLGHRETNPLLTQARLASMTSEKSNLSIVLFDEIEKAAPSLIRILLGVLDKGTLRLGDNNSVNFERTIIFMTSNLGSAGMHEQGVNRFQMNGRSQSGDTNARVEETGMAAVRRHFSPEFYNRVDDFIVFRNIADFRQILERELSVLNETLTVRLGNRRVFPELTESARTFLLEVGTSKKYGARELKRAIHRHLIDPLAQLLTSGEAPPMSVVKVTHRKGSARLTLTPKNGDASLLEIMEAA
jgi:ATP-dependent Clp protease ATP-binding subunit ClpA